MLKKIFFLVFIFLSLINKTYTTDIGSDTAVSIIPADIDSANNPNVLKSFGSAQNGLNFLTNTTTLTFQSVFPVSGPVYLNGGKLYLEKDLIYTNPGYLASGGTIYGNNHIISRSAVASNVTLEGLGEYLLALVSRVLEPRAINSIDWSYNDNYIASVIPSGAGRDLLIYSFTNSILTRETGIDLSGSGYSIKWHPNSYYVALANTQASRQLKVYTFTPPSSLGGLQFRALVGAQAVSWKPSGDYLAAGGTDNTNTIAIYSFSAGTLSAAAEGSKSLTTQDVSKNCLVWAPNGNGNYLAAGLTTDGTNPELVIYQITGSSPSLTLTLTARAQLNQTITSIDWSPTGTYLSLGLSGGTDNLKIYKFNVNSGENSAPYYTKLTEAESVVENTTVLSTSWKKTGDQLIVGLAYNPSTGFRLYDFDSSTEILTFNTGLSLNSDVNDCQWSQGNYIARAGASGYSSVYEPISTALTSNNVRYILNCDTYIKTPLAFDGSCFIDGRGYNLSVSDNGSIIVNPNSTLTIKNAQMQVQKPTTFALQGRTSSIIFDDSNFNLYSDLNIGDGSMQINNDVIINGAHNFNYLTNYTSTINAFSNLKLENGATLNIGRNPNKTQQPLVFTDNTSELEINDASLNITNSGINITKGKVIFSGGNPNLSINSTDTYSGLIFGDGTESNDPIIQFNSGSKTDINFGSVAFNLYNKSGKVLFNTNDSNLAILDDSYLRFLKSLDIENGAIILSGQSNFVKNPDTYFTTLDTIFSYTDSKEEFYFTGTVDNFNNFILDKNGELVLTIGNLSRNITVSQDNNIISGYGGFYGNLNFIDQNSKLDWALFSKFQNNIDLNNGSISLEQDTGFFHDKNFTGSGLVALNNHEFSFGNSDLIDTSTIYWTGQNSSININAKLSLTGTWTFKGNFIIDGNSNNLYLLSDSKIIIEKDSSIEFRNLAINNLHDANIYCTDNSSKIIFNNSTICQGKDFKLNKGQIRFRNNVDLITRYVDSNITFSYDSSQTSTIEDHTTLTIHDGINFSIGKTNGGSLIQPLEFIDKTSILQLNGCTLHITSSGANFTKGKILVSNNSTIETEPTQLDNSLIIGNAEENNDFLLEIGCAAILTLRSGKIVYNNYSPTNGIIFDNPSSILQVNFPYALHARRSFTLANGITRTTQAPLPINSMDPGIDINYDNIVRWQENPYAVQRIKATIRRNPTTELNDLILNNNDYFYIEQGNSNIPTHLNSGNITIGGSGNLSGPIYIEDPSVNLYIELLSDLQSDLYLGNGNLILNDDLKFISGKKIIGTGTINLNKHRLFLGTEELTFDTPIFWNSASGFDLSAKTSLTNSWTFDGICNLNGHGNILELGPLGKLAIRPESTLYLTDINIKNLGNNNNGFIFYDNSSSLHLSNVYVELDNNYSTTIGGIYVEGPTTFGLKNYNWLFDNHGSLTIDGVTLWKDGLGIINNGNINFGSGNLSQYLSLTDSGTIKLAANLDILRTDTSSLQTQIKNNSNAIILHDQYFQTIDHGYNYLGGGKYLDLGENNSKDLSIHTISNPAGNIYRLNSDIYLSQDHKLIIPAGYNQIDGNGHTINFAQENNSNVLSIPENTTLTTTNITLYGFEPNCIKLNTGSNLIFNDNTNIEILKNIDLNQTWSFAGNTILNSYGNNIKLKLRLDNIKVLGQNSRLRLKETVLKNLRENNFSITNNTGSFVLQNSELILDQNFNFSTGTIKFENNVIISGTSSFIYSTVYGSTIGSNSVLKLDMNSSFSYAPTKYGANNLLIMEDRSSILFMDGATLNVSKTGLILSKGTLKLDHKNFLTNGDSASVANSISEGIIWGDETDELNIEILPGSSIDLKYGILKYNNN